MKEPSCIFCKIAHKEIPSATVLETDDVFAFRDLNPQAPVHVLVVPKAHLARLSAASPADEALLGKCVAAAAAVAKAEGLSSYRLVVNDGADAGQSVFHLHVHVLGGRLFTWPPG